MIYVVDIVGPNGGKATKEYDASSMRVAWYAWLNWSYAVILNVRSLTYG